MADPAPTDSTPAYGPFRTREHGAVEVALEPEGLRVRPTAAGHDEEAVIALVLLGGLGVVVTGSQVPAPLSWVLYAVGVAAFAVGAVGVLVVTLVGYGAVLLGALSLLTPGGRRRARGSVAGARRRWRELRTGHLVPWGSVRLVSGVEGAALRWRSRWRVRVVTAEGALVLASPRGRRRRAEALVAAVDAGRGRR